MIVREPEKIYQIINRKENLLEFLVISTPRTVGDRIEINASSR